MYGKGVEQQALQKAMPTPQAQQPKAASPQPTRQRQAQAAAPAPLPPQRPVDPMAAMQSLRGRANLFGAPTARPDEPVTSGLSVGPGAGPEALGMAQRSPTGDLLRHLSRVLGDDQFALLAQRANL